MPKVDRRVALSALPCAEHNFSQGICATHHTSGMLLLGIRAPQLPNGMVHRAPTGWLAAFQVTRQEPLPQRTLRPPMHLPGAAAGSLLPAARAIQEQHRRHSPSRCAVHFFSSARS